MFLSLVRPDRISSPMTRIAAVTVCSSLSGVVMSGAIGGPRGGIAAYPAPIRRSSRFARLGRPRRGGTGEAVGERLAEAAGGQRHHGDRRGTAGVEGAQAGEQVAGRLHEVAALAQLE